MHLELYVYLHASMWQQLMRGEAMSLRENQEWYMGGFGKRKGKEEILQL